MIKTRTTSNTHARERRPVNRPCPFCTNETNPDYKDARTLKTYLTDKGKIVARTRSGVCLSHQRILTLAIKRARFMALVPYVSLAR